MLNMQKICSILKKIRKEICNNYEISKKNMLNMQKNMPKICEQYVENMQKNIQKKYAQYAKKYAENMQKICSICKNYA